MRVQLSGNLLRYVDYHREVEVDGTTLAEGLGHVAEKHPDFKRVILDSDGNIRLIHRFFLNGELLSREEFDRSIGSADVVAVLTPIAGG